MLTGFAVTAEATVAAVVEATLLTDELAFLPNAATTGGQSSQQQKTRLQTVILSPHHTTSDQATPINANSSQHVGTWINSRRKVGKTT
jgi:hypothetical protein